MYRAMDLKSTPKDPDSKWQNALVHGLCSPAVPQAPESGIAGDR